jgi:hypothetical protein
MEVLLGISALITALGGVMVGWRNTRKLVRVQHLVNAQLSAAVNRANTAEALLLLHGIPIPPMHEEP